MTTDIKTLLERLVAAFPKTAPLQLKPAGDLGALPARFGGGHAARWFAAGDGQVDEETPFFLGHSLCSLGEALDAMRIADDLRAGPDGYWVEPSWIAIASDGAGQHLMIDDKDGRVLAVAHDDDHVTVLGSAPEAWLQQLLDDHARGAVVWDETFGLIAAAELARIEAARVAAEARRAPAPLPLKHKVGLAVSAALMTVVIGVVIWLLERGR